MDSAFGDRSVADIEVSGGFVEAVTVGVEAFGTDTRASARAVLREHDLAAVETDKWYPLGASVDAIEAVDDLVGDRSVHALGQRVARVVDFPEDVGGVPGGLDALDDVYRAQHRGGDAGGYAFRQIGSTDGRVECRTPYPCTFDRGVIEGVAVAHARGFVCVTEVGDCGDESDRCTYDVSW